VRTWRGLIVAVLALLMLTGGGSAFAATPRTSVTDIEDEVMCVACGVALDIAESPQATQERQYIRQLVAQGLTKQQIKAELVSEYGDRVLATPKDEGFGRAAYIVPIAIALVALLAGAFFVPKWRRKRGDDEGAEGQGPRLTDADARRVEEDLARYEV
jgi:cytochrome c-type biogenesis protein CcmH